MGRGHMALLTNLDAWHSEPLRGMWHLLRSTGAGRSLGERAARRAEWRRNGGLRFASVKATALVSKPGIVSVAIVQRGGAPVDVVRPAGRGVKLFLPLRARGDLAGPDRIDQRTATR